MTSALPTSFNWLEVHICTGGKKMLIATEPPYVFGRTWQPWWWNLLMVFDTTCWY
jgi:hypothetical protein